MEDRKPVGIFPFRAELLPIVKRFDQLQSKFILKRVFSYPGSGLVGKDAAYACNQPDVGIEVEQFGEDNLEEIETVILFNPLEKSKKTDEDLLQLSKTSLQHGRSVLLCCNFTDSVVESASELKESFPNFAFSFDNNFPKERSFGKAMYYKRLDVPVILFGSLVKNPDTLEAICYLNEYFSKIDMKCLVISNTSAGELFGFKNLSPILDSKDMADSTKIEEMNRYANDLVSELNPSFVLVEAPDAVMRFNDITPNGFGVLSYMVSQAFQPDHLICSIPFELAVPEMVKALSKDFEIRLGTPISAALATNIVVDSAENLQTHVMSSLFVPMSYSMPKLSQVQRADDIPIFSVINKNDPRLFMHITDLLAIHLDRR